VSGIVTHASGGESASRGPLGATGVYGPAVTSETPANRLTLGIEPARTSGDGFNEELRCLLRSRLILVHILALAITILLALLSLVAPREADSSLRPDQGSPWRLALPLAEGLIGVVVLWRSRRISLSALRRWELAHFGIFAAYYGLQRFEMLAYLAKGAPNPPPIEIAFQGAVSLNGFVCLILSYGVLIPNARRRSLLIIIALNVVPIVAAIAAAVVNPGLRGALPPVLVQVAVVLTFPSAIAVFAASRASALQRRAFEAERRARQMGQYTLKRKLGEGGMGEVFLAEHHLLKRPCAVKFIRPELSCHPATAARFAKEVQAVTGLTHFNTVRVYDYGRSDDGSFYYVMEYLDGPTLEGLIQDYGPLPPGRAVYLLRQLCGALAEAHAAGLIHRDLKPGNVIVARQGGACDVAKLLDFGLVLDEALTGPDARLTQAGVVLGTPAYMAPEQAAGEPMGARGDVYGLGALAFFILAGRPPFEGKSALKVMAAHRSTPAPQLEEVPGDLAAVIAQCLAKDPEERFPSMAALERGLAGCTCARDWSAERAMTWWAENTLNRQTSL
jgi:tRNA A-37 threonylcarbamoyl transferase component Bud32